MAELPPKAIDGVLQLIFPPVAIAPGGALFSVTEAVAVAVQLLVAFVIVTV